LLRIHSAKLIVQLHAIDGATSIANAIAFSRDANRSLCTDATPRQSDQQRLQLFGADRDLTLRFIARPHESTLMESPRAQPDADPIVYQHLDAVAVLARFQKRVILGV
jgi:hypothetical protein